MCGYICVCRCLARLEMSDPSEARVTHVIVSHSAWYWALNLGLLQEQYTLLPSDPPNTADYQNFSFFSKFHLSLNTDPFLNRREVLQCSPVKD